MEFNDDELAKLTIAIFNTLLSRNESMTDDKLTSIVGYNAIDVRRALQLLFNIRIAEVAEEYDEAAGRLEQVWSVKKENIKRHLVNIINGVLDKISRLMDQFSAGPAYICPTCFKRYTPDDALLYNYRCPLDGSELVYLNPQDILPMLSDIEARLKNILKIINESQI